MYLSSREVVKSCYKSRLEGEDGLNLVSGRRIAAAAPAPSPKLVSESKGVEYGSTKYFFLCALGGIPSCGVTHGIVVPLDLVKTRLQVNPAKYKGLFNGFRVTVQEEGPRALTKGWVPTVIGYSMQGACKFGFYEFFKVFYANVVGEKIAFDWRTTLYLCSSASAEFLADIALSPWEATRVKMQTTKGFPTKLLPALNKMYQEEGANAFFKSLIPLWGRQIPYTMMKFACFERTVELIYKTVIPKPREQCSKGLQLVVTFAAGYIAGIFCAIVSHPADTIVSRLNQEKGLTAMQIAKKLGFANLWKGLTTRIFMIGTLTALQWFIYDFVKVALNIPHPPPPGQKKN